MRRYLVMLFIIATAILIGIELRLNPGYLLISINHTAIEMHLWVGVMGLILVFLALHFLWRILNYGGSIPERLHLWSLNRRKHSAVKTTNRGLIELAEGNWRAAEKLLSRSAKNSTEPLLNYLALALAAQGQKAYERRAEYLHQAHNIAPHADMAIGITQAQLQMNHHQYEQALATLSHLHELNPKQQMVLRLLKHLYIKLNNWRQVKKLLPALKKHGGYPDDKYQDIAKRVYQHLFAELDNIHDVTMLWDNLSSNFQREDVIRVAYAQRLIDMSAHEQAYKFIIKQLKKHWSSELVALYADIQLDSKQQYQIAQKWFDVHQDDVNLLTTLGRLAMQNQLWGQAQDYLQAALAIKATPMLYLLLGDLAEKIGNSQNSCKYYRSGLVQLD